MVLLTFTNSIWNMENLWIISPLYSPLLLPFFISFFLDRCQTFDVNQEEKLVLERTILTMLH